MVVVVVDLPIADRAVNLLIENPVVVLPAAQVLSATDVVVMVDFGDMIQLVGQDVVVVLRGVVIAAVVVVVV